MCGDNLRLQKYIFNLWYVLHVASTQQLYWWIHNGTNDSEEFAYDIEMACALGYLRVGHIVTLDNAIIHSDKDNKHLEEWLWWLVGVFVLWLPTRSPEWNPDSYRLSYGQTPVSELRSGTIYGSLSGKLFMIINHC